MASATPRIAQYTFRRQAPAEVCTGLVAGVSGLASFAALKSLGAPEWTPQVIAVLGQSVWFLAPGLEAFVAHLDARRAFLWLGFLANLPLVALVLLPVERTGDDGAGTGAVAPFAAAIVLLMALDALYLPLRGALVRANYPEAVRGGYFSRLAAISKVAHVVSSKASGWLLHADPRFLRVVFPVAGIVGLVEHWLLSRIRLHRTENPSGIAGGGGLPSRFAESLRDGWAILLRDRDFRTYEVAFMLYGFGFAMSNPLLPVFADGVLGLGYSDYTWAQGVADPVCHLAAGLLLGSLLPRLGVVRVSGAAFLGLAAYFVAMATATGPLDFVLLSALAGASMSAVNLGWSLGPLRFAPQGRARAYAATHMCLVGVRLAIAPFVGFALSQAIGVRAVFLVSAGLVAAGAVTAAFLARRVR